MSKQLFLIAITLILHLPVCSICPPQEPKLLLFDNIDDEFETRLGRKVDRQVLKKLPKRQINGKTLPRNLPGKS